MSLIPSDTHILMADHTRQQVIIRITNYKKKVKELEKLCVYLNLLSLGLDHVNAYIQKITRFPDVNLDDVAWLVVKSRKIELFLVCINTKDDFKVHGIAMKVHNLTPYKRNMLVEQMKKHNGMDAHIRNAMSIHAVKNFEIKKI